MNFKVAIRLIKLSSLDQMVDVDGVKMVAIHGVHSFGNLRSGRKDPEIRFGNHENILHKFMVKNSRIKHFSYTIFESPMK